MTTGALILNGESDGHSLAWERPSALAFPPEAIACLQEGVEQLQAGDAEAALATLSRSIELAPDFGEAHVFVGLANALSSRIYPAIDHLELATRLQPDNFATHYTLAQLNFKLRIPQKGYEAAENALRCVSTLEQRKMLTQLLKEERRANETESLVPGSTSHTASTDCLSQVAGWRRSLRRFCCMFTGRS